MGLADCAIYVEVQYYWNSLVWRCHCEFYSQIRQVFWAGKTIGFQANFADLEVFICLNVTDQIGGVWNCRIGLWGAL